MKKLICLFVCLCSVPLTKTFAQTDAANALAKVYIIRATGHDGSLVNFRVIVDDMVYCKISNNRYSILDFKPGKYTFYITSWAKPKTKPTLGLEVQLEAGKTYYLRMVVKDLYIKDPYYFEEITSNSALPLLEKYKEDTNCDK